jgi:hypothetical protein
VVSVLIQVLTRAQIQVRVLIEALTRVPIQVRVLIQVLIPSVVVSVQIRALVLIGVHADTKAG